MKRLNIPLVLDTLFAGVCAFLLFFTAIRFYTKSAVAGLAFGISACVLFGALGFIYISGKQRKSLVKSGNEKNKKLLSLHLSLSADDYIINLFEKCFGEGAKKRGKCVICGEQCCFFNFKMQPLSEDDIAQVIKRKTDLNKVIYCTDVSPQAALLADNFNVKIVRMDEVYAMLKEKELLPDKYVYEGKIKSGLFKKIRARFSRRICAPLFWSGLCLLGLSYVTYFPLYYIISGGILLTLAAVALVIN